MINYVFAKDSKNNKFNNILNNEKTFIVPCNASGEAPFGLLGDICARYPDVAAEYAYLCSTKNVIPGMVTPIYRHGICRFLLICVKEGRYDAPQYDYIEAGLEAIALHYKQEGIQGLATVKIGCSKSDHGISWDKMGKLMARIFSKFDIPVDIYIGERDAQWHFTPKSDVSMQETQPLRAITLSK